MVSWSQSLVDQVISHQLDWACLEQIVLRVLLPTLLTLLFILASWQSWSMRSLQDIERNFQSHWILRGKVALLACALVSSFASLAIVWTLRHSFAVLSLSYALEPVALASAIVLTYINHQRTRRSSSILLLFWPPYAAGVLLWAHSLFSQDFPYRSAVFALKCAVGITGFLSFVLECLGPEFGDPNTNKSVDNTVNLENPFLTANIFSRWSFGWMTPLMKRGASRYITENDLPPLLARDESAKLSHDLHKAFAKHSSLWISLFVAYGGPYLVAVLLKVIQDLLAFLQPQLLRLLLVYISSYQISRNNPIHDDAPRKSAIEGFVISWTMFIAAVIQSIILNQYFQRCLETGMRVRAGLVTVIYEKALVLSNDERQGRASGDIVNLMSVDTSRLQDLCAYGIIVISGPLQITLAFISLYNLLGWSAFVGVAIMIFSIPLNTVIAQVLKRLQEKQMKNRDKRTRLMSELLANIKSIKLYAWEFAFVRRVLLVRNDLELKMLKKIGLVTAFNTTLWSGIPLLVAFSSFATAALTSSTPLTSEVIFPSISLFMLLQFPLAMFSQVTSNIVESIVSVHRLSAFLKADELQPDARKVIEKADLKAGDDVLSIMHGEFRWSKSAPVSTLEDVNLSVKKGELVGVLGRVGAGKTSLLSAIVGDMIRSEGEVELFGSISYAPQNPWILSASIRQNILFSHEYDEDFYNEVVDACALGPDLAVMSQGDLTEVGENGLTLSGGQRARISLARVVYARADLILLDDVLAAVDSHVARHVFDHVVGPQGLLASKARILVTNNITFLKDFDQLVYVRRGIIIESGSLRSLMSDSQSELSKLVRGNRGGDNSLGMNTPLIRSGHSTPEAGSEGTLSYLGLDDSGDSGFTTATQVLKRKPSLPKAVIAEAPPPRSSSKGMSKEHLEQGKVKREVYLQYLKAASRGGVFAFLLAIFAQQIVGILANLTLRNWGEHNRDSGDNSGMFQYLLIYGLFSLSSTLLGGAASIIMWVFCSLRGAKYLHDSMLNAVIRAPLSFFELTPTGRTLNLFSRDTYVVDQILARMIQMAVRTMAVCFSIVIVIGYSFPPFLVAIFPLGFFYMRIMRYYLATSRELKRLDAVSKSPIFTWFSETLTGLSTIRAFHQQNVFIASNSRHLDRNQICFLPSINVNRWLALRLEFVGAVIILITSSLAVFALITTGIDGGLVGLVLSYAMNTTSSLNWVVRSVSEVEQNIVSVERILRSIQTPSEAPYEIPDSKPSEMWPFEGEVEFRQYSARYRPELDLALKEVSVVIKPREKIGICGRTGSGKSSLLLALFRIIEPSSGTIFIDGVDTKNIGLFNLRSVISIVPQSPDLFEGSIRENIDPLGAHQDVDIWVALGQAHLKEYVEGLSEGLDAAVSEGGSSLSSGQRQLLCFSRALLRKSKILVLDEATSAVDLDTDREIQEIVQGPLFEQTTMLTIAHRLNTIMDSDRILVMDNGRIAELDSPQNLLANKTSLFYSLAAEAGLVDTSVAPV